MGELSLLQTFLWYKIFAKTSATLQYFRLNIRSISLTSTLVALQRGEIRYVFSSATHFFELKWGGLAMHIGSREMQKASCLQYLLTRPKRSVQSAFPERKSSELFLEIMKAEHGD